MATLDRDDDAVVIRIVYDGPPTSGKTTSLRTLAERLGQKNIYTPEEVAGRTLYFDWMEYTGGRFDGRQIRCQIISAPGQRALSARRNLLLSSADAVVFVADTSSERMGVSWAHLEDLRQQLQNQAGLTPGVVLQANKRDVRGAEPIENLRGRHGLAVVESVASSGDGVREAFVFAVRLALDRAREQQQRGALLRVAREEDPAGELLRTMQALPLEASTHAFFPAPLPPPPPSSPQRGASPVLPDDTVASGCVWPPIHGRVLLQAAAAGTHADLRELGLGNWVAESSEGWRFYSSATQVYSDGDVARSALVRWAQAHALVTDWLSPQRCIALCDHGDGTFRLWQVVRSEKSLWSVLSEALAQKDAQRIAEATALCERVTESWTAAPADLPCTLESVGAREEKAVFIGFMPELGAEPSPLTLNRRSKLRHQVESLVKAELG